ncbi:MAG: FKBP-type peptidyl-prolyl cis-trans isomerase [Acidobacteriota bacterium]
MRSMTTLLLLLLLPVCASAQDASAPKTDKDRLSYAMGMDLGNQLKLKSVDIDPAVFAQGLKAALAGSKTLLTEDDVKTIIGDLQKSMMAKQTEMAKALADKNKTEGEAFLAANKAKPGVVTLPSGIQYKILTAGMGKKPAVTDQVVCQYRGTLIDGKEIDSTYARKEPATIPVSGVIKGWTEILQLMPTGSKWQVIIPAALAYGERGAGAAVGPNATLIFEIELTSIKDAAPVPVKGK